MSALANNATAYVESRRNYVAKLKAESEAAYERVKAAAERASSVAHELAYAMQKAEDDAEASGEPVVYPRVTLEQIEGAAAPLPAVMNERGAVMGGWQVAMELALLLDEAVAGLAYYANDATWREVQPDTPAAQDKGQRAKTALYRINPS